MSKFKEGDVVRILTGEHSGTVAEVAIAGKHSISLYMGRGRSLFHPDSLSLVKRDGKEVTMVGMKVKVVCASDWVGWTKRMSEVLIGNVYTVLKDRTDEPTPVVELEENGYIIPLDTFEVIEDCEEEAVVLEEWEKF